MRIFRSRKHKRQKKVEFSDDELDEQEMHDLEETLLRNSGIVILKGAKLREYEDRISRLTELFKRTARLPLDRPMPLASTNPLARVGPSVAGPSQQSMDSANDFSRMTAGRNRATSISSSNSSIIPENAVIEQNQMAPPILEEAIVMPSDSPMYLKETHPKTQTLQSESDDEEIPAAVLTGSTQADSSYPGSSRYDTARFSEMGNWKRTKEVADFSDYNSPLPMKVSSFFDLKTQNVILSRIDDDRVSAPQTPEKDRSTTDGLLFAVDSFKMLHSARASTASSEVDSEAGESVLSRIRDNRRSDCNFKASRINVSPNLPVNVFDDVAPTRLHAHIFNIPMNQEQNLVRIMQ